MAEIIGAIERALGAVLNGIYEVIPAYGVAIMLLTIAVRSLLIPLTVKQIKGFAAQQKLAPEMKKIQAKYRAQQQKSKDRAEVQQLRLAMNKELQELYSAHGASMFGGCLPAVSQFPVLIAMFAVFRASVVVLAAATLGGAPVSPDVFDEKEMKGTVCRPVTQPSADGATPTQVLCPTKTGDQIFTISDLRDAQDDTIKIERAPWITGCSPYVADQRDSAGVITKVVAFKCTSTLGSGHLPKDGKLFRDLTADRASMFGLESGCSASQVSSPKKIKECTASGDTGSTTKAIPYYLLVLLVAATTYYQGKQMAARSTGQAAQQQQMMTRIMPVLFGFLSISFPAGLNVYMLTTNLFSIGQQGFLFKKMGARLGMPGAPEGGKAKSKEIKDTKVIPDLIVEPPTKKKPPQNRSKKGKKRK